MTIIEAIGCLLFADTEGWIDLPHCLLPDGSDVGAEFVTVLALVSGLLHLCESVEDIIMRLT